MAPVVAFTTRRTLPSRSAWMSESDAITYARTQSVAVVPDPPLLHDLDLATLAVIRRSIHEYDAVPSAWNLFADLANSVVAAEFALPDSASADLHDRLFRLAAVLLGLRRRFHVLPSRDWSRFARLIDAGCRLFERVVVMRAPET